MIQFYIYHIFTMGYNQWGNNYFTLILMTSDVPRGT